MSKAPQKGENLESKIYKKNVDSPANNHFENTWINQHKLHGNMEAMKGRLKQHKSLEMDTQQPAIWTHYPGD